MAYPALTRRLLLIHGFGAGLLLQTASVAAPRPPLIRPRRSRIVLRAPPLIFLDPGHGGKDPGAIGPSGIYEKHVALAAAGELARQLHASGRYRVALTRQSDIFIPLQDRIETAQTHRATLFISIHADALYDPAVRGASVYTRETRASDRQTASLAARENAADRYAGRASPRSLFQWRTAAESPQQELTTQCSMLQEHVVSALAHTVPLLDNPARHADFMVLQSTQIPSVLVEMGFMSNPQDESALRQGAHRATIARAVRRAIDAYFVTTHVRVASASS